MSSSTAFQRFDRSYTIDKRNTYVLYHILLISTYVHSNILENIVETFLHKLV